MADAEKSEEVQAKAAGKSPVILVAATAVVAMLIGGGAVFFMLGGQPAEEVAATADVELNEEGQPITFGDRVFSLEPFIMNITPMDSIIKITGGAFLLR